MVINDPAALVNAVICAVIVCALMFYQRRGARHRPGISILAYLLVLIYASIPFQFYLRSLRTVPLAGGNGKRNDMRRRAVGTG